MEPITISLASGTMLIMAVIFSYILGWANKTFAVEVNEKVEAINNVLPGANCGGCSYVGCNDYAEAIVLKGEDVNKCTVGGSGCANAIAEIMGVEAVESAPLRPVVLCLAKNDEKKGMNEYKGETSCLAATFVSGIQDCVYGCLGLGDCVAACDYDAISIKDGSVTIDYSACIGCGACSRACPRSVISMVPFKGEKIYAVFCSNKEKAKAVKNVCDVGCIGCAICSKKSDIFEMDGNLSRINYDKFDAMENPEAFAEAVEKCPSKGLIGYIKNPYL